MVLYLTPGQYRAMNFGTDTASMIDAELAPILTRASADANSFCQVPANHSFLGGVVVGETHLWSVSPYDQAPQRRVFPYHRPVISIESMRVHVTASQYLNFDNAELHYEPSGGFIEPASAALTSYGLFGSSVLPFVGLTQPYAKIDYTYGFRVPFDERAFYTGNGSYTWRAQTGFWTSDPVVVKINGVVANSANYTLDRMEGTITWTAATRPTGTDTVEVSGISRLPWDIAIAVGLIATDRISSRSFVASQIPASVRSFRVAEVSVDRGFQRGGPSSVMSLDIPQEAADKLGPFVYYPLAMA